MFEFGFGFEKLLLIGFIALIIVGPDDLPKVMYTVGTWMRKLRTLAQEFQGSLDNMMAAEEIRQLRQELAQAKSMAANPLEIPTSPLTSPATLAATLPPSVVTAHLMANEEALEKGLLPPHPTEGMTVSTHAVPTAAPISLSLDKEPDSASRKA